MIKKFLNFVGSQNVTIDQLGHQPNDRWQAIKAGDVVEYNLRDTNGITYSVEEIFSGTNEAKIRRLNIEKQEVYTAPLEMLRSLAK